MRLALSLALFLVAAASTVVGLRQRLWWRVLRRTELATPDELVTASLDGQLERRLRAVAGLAGSAELMSTVNGEPCVWHRHAVRHEQVRVRTDRSGRTRRSSSRKRVADVSSTDLFALAGSTEEISVLPAEMRVHRPQRRANRVLPGIASKPIPPSAELFSGGSVRNTYHHREWIITTGTPLYILGEVAGRGPRVAVRRPAKGLHLISTRSAAQLVRRAYLWMLGGFVAAGLSLIGAVLVLVLW
jgi:hypothetical protein